MLKLCALGVLSAFVGALLSEYGWRGKRVFGVLSAVVMMIGLIDGAGEIFESVFSLSEAAGAVELTKTVMKVLGVGYIFGFSSDVAKELGETAVSGVLTLAGKIEIIALVFPYFQKILEFGVELVK